jgi:hypothetical protein
MGIGTTMPERQAGRGRESFLAKRFSRWLVAARKRLPTPLRCGCLLFLSFALLIAAACTASAADVVWLEADRFDSVGGWQRDTQHVDTMGSVYLLTTGLGRPVDDAVTRAEIPAAGTYRLWVRCRDWFPSHSPGIFRVLVGGRNRTNWAVPPTMFGDGSLPGGSIWRRARSRSVSGT